MLHRFIGAGTRLALAGNPSTTMSPKIVGFAVLVLSTACSMPRQPQRVPDPLTPSLPSAFDAAGEVALTARTGQSFDGLHNVFELSDRIISGSEPENEAAFAQLQAMGVKTILSVDGKAPDSETAARFGMRYVHVPIRYKGIEPEELSHIAKTFREQEGPFFVHCYHGQHRGPAAAAIGRVVLDGASRQTAIAEMRQWCGTSKSYEGLYAVIAYGALPDAAATAQDDFDFPSRHRFEGVRAVMIDAARSFDTLKELVANDWKPLGHHPDAKPLTEATVLAEGFAQLAADHSLSAEPSDYQAWMRECDEWSQALVGYLRAADRGDAESGKAAAAALKEVGARCAACHKPYRN
jgi:protein tyrosine phosphatase (PTP) superfamily phosphohydrolase (DUF442 family)